MSLDKVFDIAGSGMSAQSLRLNTVASNIANAETVSSSTGDTYRARNPVFATIFNAEQATGASLFSDEQQAGAGVQVLGIVNVVEEMANMMAASRSYQTNVEVMNTAKTMLQRVLTLGQ